MYQQLPENKMAAEITISRHLYDRVTSTIYVTSIYLESTHLENKKSKNLDG